MKSFKWAFNGTLEDKALNALIEKKLETIIIKNEAEMFSFFETFSL